MESKLDSSLYVTKKCGLGFIYTQKKNNASLPSVFFKKKKVLFFYFVFSLKLLTKDKLISWIHIGY